MTDTEHNPVSLRIVAGLFVCIGVLAGIKFIVNLCHAHINLDLTLLCLWIGPGLLRHNRTWRICALVFLWISLIVLPIGLVLSCMSEVQVYDIYGFTVGPVPLPLVIAVKIGLFLLVLWEYRVLTRTDIKDLFEYSVEKASA